MKNKNIVILYTTLAAIAFYGGVKSAEYISYVERTNENLEILRSNPDLVELQDGVFCDKNAVAGLSKAQLLGDGFCNTFYSKWIK